MAPEKPDRKESLLDLHLEQLTTEDQAWLEQELDRDAELRKSSDRLDRILQPLDSWQVEAAPASLADNVLRYVRQSADATIQSDTSSIRGRLFGRLPLRWREFVAAAACIALLIGTLWPGLTTLRSRSQQVMCAGNLSSIFRGTSVYQEVFAGALPYAGCVDGSRWLPSGPTDRPFVSNSRHMFLLVKLQQGPKPGDFICPADRDAIPAEPMPNAELAERDDFASAANVSYDSLNLCGPKPNLRPRVPLVYVSDPNPLFIGARFNKAVNADTTNSPAHGGRGQNILTTVGNTEFLRTPFFGVRKDNVWLAGNIRYYNGTEAPVNDEDVQLVPGYPSANLQDPNSLRN